MKSFLSAIVLSALCLAQIGCDSSGATHPLNDDSTRNDTVQPAKQDAPSLIIAPSNDDADPNPDAALKTDDQIAQVNTTDQAAANPPDNNAAEAKEANDDKIHDITFIDLQCGLDADIRFREFMLSERAKDLIGKRIRIAGNMFPDGQFRGITEFILLKNKECKFGPGGQADHLMVVELKKDLTTSYRSNDTVYEVVGRLKLNPDHGEAGFTYSIYDLDCESVTIR